MKWKIQMRSRTTGVMINEVIEAGNSHEAKALAEARYPGFNFYNQPSPHYEYGSGGSTPGIAKTPWSKK